MRLLLAVLLIPAAAAAQQTPPNGAVGDVALRPHADAPALLAATVAAPVRIDGRLDEAAWAEAEPATNFTQLDPQEGQPVSERSEVRILYDDAALYVGARFHDTGEVRTRLGRRDMSLGDSDWLTIIFDSFHDHRSGFGFEINPSGVRRDQTRAAGNEDDSWDPVWEGAATVDDGGWTAELRIPFSQLRFNRSKAEVAEGAAVEEGRGGNPIDDQTWGLQIERTIARKREFAQWSFTPRTHSGGIPRYGHLHGLRNLQAGKRLEVLPYTVARLERIEAGDNPFRDDSEAGADVGVDLKYRVTSNLTLDATLNPDFGQVEVDPAQVNLTAIETRYQEKRPFFIEGAEMFDFGNAAGNSVFYSRRIGRPPQVRLPYGTQDAPDAARIVGAAKLTGRTSSGWSVGVMNAITAREESRFLGPDGLQGSAPVEPLTNYFLGRLRREFRDGLSIVGGLLTAVNRDLDTDLLRSRLRSEAYTGGLDFRHEWAERNWRMRGFVSGSYVAGDERAITATQVQAPWRYFGRPDADHLEVDSQATSLAGIAAAGTLTRRVGRHWNAELHLATVSPGYEVNDIGFQARADRVDGQFNLEYNEPRPGKLLRSWGLEGMARQERNYAWDHILSTTAVTGFAQTLGYWTGFAHVQRMFERVDVRLTRGGPAAIGPAHWVSVAGLESDGRKPLVAELQAVNVVEDGGGWFRELELGLTIKPAASWNLTLEPSVSRSHSTAQYIGVVTDPRASHTFGRRYLFAQLDQTTFALETRLNLTFRPGLTLQLYAQPFLSSADFGDAAELAAPRTYDFDVYGRDIGEVEPTQNGVRVYPGGFLGGGAFTVPRLDFNLRSLRGNAVLRWEWRAGSTLFLAWQQQREDVGDVGDFDFGRDRGALFRAPSDNVFLFKLNYWLNP